MCQLGYELTGDPGGTPLALVHGWGAEASFMRPIAEHFPGRRVMLIDLPGYGRSAGIRPPSHDFRDTSELLYNTLESGCDLMAWSLSTLFAIHACTMRPRKVASLVSICGTPRFPRDPNWPGMPFSIVVKTRRFLNSRRAMRMLGTFFKKQILNLGEHNEQSLALSVDELLERLGRLDPATLLHGIDLMATIDVRQELDSLSIPVLHLFGAHDLLVPPALARAMTQQHPGREAFIFPYSGHMPFLSESRLFYRKLDEFYARVNERMRPAQAPEQSGA